MSDDAAHSVLAPSSADRWVPCPGSVPLEAQYPEDDSLEAKEGTAAHWFASQSLKLALGQIEAFDDKIAPNGIPIDDEMREGVPTYVEDVLKTHAVYGERKTLVVEHQVKCPSVHADNWGTTDAALYDQETATIHIWDFKWGHGFVEVFENWQLLDYLAGVLDELKEDRPEYKIILRIVQPRSYHKDGPIREWKLTSTQAREYTRHLNSAAHEARGNNPATRPGLHCTHCLARHACKALQATDLDIVDRSSDATPLDLPPAALGKELSALRRARALLDARISGLESQAEAEIRKGVSVPGWTIEHTTGREQWARSDEEILLLGEMLGIKLDAGVKLVTPNQARKLGLDETMCREYSERRAGAAKLVPVSTVAARKAFAG
jgi:hypothetical protein